MTIDQALAVMTLLLKVHKAGNKSRAVVTGNSSNSVGLSITVSMFLEAVAASIDSPYEVSSSEDLIAVFEEVNEVWRGRMGMEKEKENIVGPETVTEILTGGNSPNSTANICDRLLSDLELDDWQTNIDIEDIPLNVEVSEQPGHTDRVVVVASNRTENVRQTYYVVEVAPKMTEQVRQTGKTIEVAPKMT